MYAYIKGRLVSKKPDRIVVEAGGIGYNIFYPAGRIGNLPPVGSEVQIYTYTSVREDALQLYGFQTEDELELYKQMLSVSGIGPKVASALLSTLTPGEIRVAIISGDTKTLCKAPGFGKRNAERLILDLKGKISTEEAIGAEVLTEEEALAGAEDGAAAEAVQALSTLGYPVKEARAAVIKAAKEGHADTEALLKAALRNIM
ncbi:MAG: Holliday junction branch migration protein RuvA [Lachnospiraceae bacterium]|nr:Holliday junction branch migration protein RuvA [Lachnospiraceae bacterium]